MPDNPAENQPQNDTGSDKKVKSSETMATAIADDETDTDAGVTDMENTSTQPASDENDGQNNWIVIAVYACLGAISLAVIVAFAMKRRNKFN